MALSAPAPRPPRPLLSRVIDHITKALGHEVAFLLAVVVVVVWFLGLTHFGIQDQNYQLLINTGTTIVTFIMVFAVQHTSNRDAQAFQIKLDELIRVTNARDDLIGVEEEPGDRLAERRAELLAERELRGARDEAGSSRAGTAVEYGR